MVWEFFGPSQMTCPKSSQKVSKKWSKNGLSKIWGQKTAQKVIKKLSKRVFWQIEVAAFGRRLLVLSMFAKKQFFDKFCWPGLTLAGLVEWLS